MKRKMVDYEVRGVKADENDEIKEVVRKITFEVDADETTLLSEEDYYCVTVECTDGEIMVEKSGECVFNKDIVNDIVADQRKVDKNVVVKVHTLKKISFSDYYYDKEEKFIFNNWYNVRIMNVESIPSNIHEIINKLRLVSLKYGLICVDINEIYKIDEMIEENFIIEEEEFIY